MCNGSISRSVHIISVYMRAKFGALSQNALCNGYVGLCRHGNVNTIPKDGESLCRGCDNVLSKKVSLHNLFCPITRKLLSSCISLCPIRKK